MNSGLNISAKQIVALAFSACIGLFLLIAGCEKEKVVPREFPKLRTMEVSGINIDGALFEGIIEKAGSEEIIEWGFVWDINQNPKIETAEYYIESYSSGKNAIQRDVLSTLVAGEHYFVRFFARTASFVVYGNEVVFESLGSRGPEISSFTPEVGLVGTNVTITGSGFSFRADSNMVKFDQAKALILEACDTMLSVVVPSELSQKESFISVTNSRKTGVSATKFKIHDMVIRDFNPKYGTTGDTVLITGAYLNSGSATNVLFNNTTGTVIAATDTTVKAIVPILTGELQAQISVTSGNFGVAAMEKFQITSPQIAGVSPTMAKIGETVTITGANFSSLPAANKVLIDSVECEVLSASKTQMQIIVPSPRPGWIPIPFSPQKPSELKVLVSEIPSNINKAFTFLTPSISDLSPAIVTFGDILTLNGTNFSKFAGEFKIYADNTLLELVSLTNEKITFKQPEGNESANTPITVYTDKFKGEFTIRLAPPTVISVSPSIVTFKEEIEIRAKYLHPDLSKNQVFFNSESIPVESINNGIIKVRMPTIITNPVITIKIQAGADENLAAERSGLLTLRKPVITSVSPLLLTKFEDTFVIDGSGFNPEMYSSESNLVRYGEWYATVLEASPTKLVCQLPFEWYFDKEEYVYTKHQLVLSCGGYNINTSTLTFFQDKPFKRRAYAPMYMGGFAFTNANMGYVLGGWQGSFPAQQVDRIWRYDPAYNSWTNYGQFPFYNRLDPIFFVANGYAYFGLGQGGTNYEPQRDLWRFDPAANKWDRMADFPGNLREYCFYFGIGDKGYIGGGYDYDQVNATYTNYSDLWEYDAQQNSWQRKNDIDLLSGLYYNQAIESGVINGVAYVALRFMQDLYIPTNDPFLLVKYDPINDSWQKLMRNNPASQHTGTSTVIGNRWYFYPAGEAQQLFYFEPGAAIEWGNVTCPESLPGAGTCFTIENKGYFGLGNGGGDSHTFWEFDPSKLP